MGRSKVNLRWLMAAGLVALLLLGPGCWSRREPESLAFILVLGIDRTETGDIKLAAQVGLPVQRDGEDGPGLKVITAQGKNISAALDSLFMQMSKRPFLSHIRLVVFGAELAREGIGPYLDFMRRDIRMRGNVKTAVAGSDLEGLLTIEDFLGSQPSLAIVDQFNINASRSQVYRVEIMDVVSMLAEPDRQVVMPVIETGADKYTLGKTAIFQGDKMVATADRNQTLGLLLLRNRVRDGVFTVTDFQNNYAAVRILNSSTRLDTWWQNSRLHVLVEVDINAEIIEKAGRVEDLETRAAHYVVNLMGETVELVQQSKSDVAGFAVDFRRRDPVRWRELAPRWGEVISDANLDLRCRVKILRQGQIP